MKLAKRICTVLALCLALNLLVAGVCLAEGQMYVAGRLGYGWASDVDRSWGGTTDSTIKYDPPLSLGAAFGYRYNWARLEGEIGYYNVSVKEGQGRSGALRGVDGRDLFYTFMLNAYADLRNNSPFTPFIGAGLGACLVDHDISFTTSSGTRNIAGDDQDWVFAYQFMAGVEWAVNKQISLEVMYRYFHLASRSHDVSGGSATEADLDPQEVHSFLLGLRFWF